MYSCPRLEATRCVHQLDYLFLVYYLVMILMTRRWSVSLSPGIQLKKIFNVSNLGGLDKRKM